MSLFRAKGALHLCSLTFLLLSLPVSAAQVRIAPQIGFHGLFQLGHPFPLKVELANTGGPLEGTLEVRAWKGGPTRGTGVYPLYHRSHVFLAAQARKSIPFTVDPDSVSRPLTLTFFGAGFRWSQEVDLRRHFSPAPLVLLVTENNFSHALPLASAAPGPLISLALGDLPSDPRAYQGVSAIIFYEQSFRDLSRRQAAALEGWVTSGGWMLILGSLHVALYQETTMSRFLPVRVAGLKRFASLPDLDRRYGKQGAPLKDLWGQDSRLVEGKVLLQEGGIPLLVEARRGRGGIFYLGLDVGRPPLSRWGGLKPLFRELLGSTPERSARLQASWDDAVFSQLLASPSFISAYVPVRSLFLWILFYLGGMGFFAWQWRQSRWGRRKLCLGFLLLNAVASVGGYLHFSHRGSVPDGVLLTATLLESFSGGYVEAQSNVALFSTQTREYALQVENGWNDLEAFFPRPGNAKEAHLVMQEEGSSTRFSFPLREWAYRLFKVRSLGPFPLHAEVEQRGDRLSLRLANLGPKDLDECWLVIQGQVFFLGDILRGSNVVREFSLVARGQAASESSSKHSSLQEIRFANRMRELLFRYSFFPESQGLSRGGGEGALFVGWVRQAAPRVWVDDAQVLAYDYTLFRAIIPFGEEQDL